MTIFLDGCRITPTMFPDGTSQVWKLDREPDHATITWRFDHEGEIMHVAQLRELIRYEAKLFMPFMPYARQDKEISNLRTFALRPFANLINTMEFSEVSAVDVHNPEFTKGIIKNFVNCEPRAFHREIVEKLGPHLVAVIFPDKGAADRYGYLDLPKVVFEKKRDQESGKILGFEIVHQDTFVGSAGKRALIIDDICDGGATFIGIAQAWKKVHPWVDLHLAVTHGIFSKGLEVLKVAGLTVHTTNSLTKNDDGFPVSRSVS